MKKRLQLFFVTTICLALVSCSDSSMTELNYNQEVEIAPGKWLPIAISARVPTSDVVRPKSDPHNLTPGEAVKQIAAAGEKPASANRRSGLQFRWNGQDVAWRGKAVPFLLREHDQTLYMVGLDRSDIFAVKFVFNKLDPKAGEFQKIKAKDFPRQIATQNMWLNLGSRHVNIAGVIIDRWNMLRVLDIENPAFSSSLTAKMWFVIETGTEYDQISYLDLNQEFLKNYIKKYKPIALPTIIKEKKPNKQIERI